MQGCVIPSLPQVEPIEPLRSNGNGNGNGHPVDVDQAVDSKYDMLNQLLSRNWQRHFPGATAKTREELPSRCSKMGCAGALFETQLGVKCVNCGREYIAALEIIHRIQRGHGTEAVDQ
jgi:hypothetical protein